MVSNREEAIELLLTMSDITKEIAELKSRLDQQE